MLTLNVKKFASLALMLSRAYLTTSNEKPTSENKSLQFSNEISHVVRHGAISEALSGAFDSIKKHSVKPSLDKSETTKALSMVISDLDIQVPSTVSSVQTSNEKTAFTGDEPFQMSFGADIAWTIVFGLMIGNAIIGNLVVFWIVLGN